MREIELIIFDMDGLMFDTERIGFADWKDAAARYGYELDEELYKCTVGSNAERTKEIYLRHFGEAFPFEAIRADKRKLGLTRLEKDGVPIKAGLYELLEYLRLVPVKKAVATSSQREGALALLSIAGVDAAFDCILCGNEVEKSKPDPDIFLKVAEKLGCLPEKCLVLEDSEAGVLAAYRAGMHPIMVPDMIEPREEVKALLVRQMATLHEVRSFLEERAWSAGK